MFPSAFYRYTKRGRVHLDQDKSDTESQRFGVFIGFEDASLNDYTYHKGDIAGESYHGYHDFPFSCMLNIFCEFCLKYMHLIT